MRVFVVLLTPFLMAMTPLWEPHRHLCADLHQLLTDSQVPAERIAEDVSKCERIEEEVRLLPPVEYRCLALEVCPE